ncbi:MAG TPA: molybdopterin dinucleotide binding domain-containing protein [Candidatus Methylomirabilis sp.]|nr:molybdopterin dinucleotide binding domain-containing protein [Candidatus Methylomirabilis sp.]
MSAMDRRSFFKIVAASGAAVAGGCGPAPENYLSAVIPPENVIPGIPSYFSSVCRECPAGCGLVAKNRDGRIVKLEGNPDHPVNAGALCIRGQAGLQGLYHPDRFRGPLSAGRATGWDEAQKPLIDKMAALVKANQGAKIAVVSGIESGTLGRFMDQWVAALGARARIAYEPLGYEALRAANRIAFGRDTVPQYVIGESSYLLSFGADFLETWVSPVEYASGLARMHGFAHGRAGTFVQIEPRLSMTGANADEWVMNLPGSEGVLALAMLKLILDGGVQAPDADVAVLREAVKDVDVAAAAKTAGVSTDTIARIAKDFAASRAGLAVGGGAAATGSNATASLVAVNLLNAAVGAVGTRIRFSSESALGRVSPYAEMMKLVDAMNKGEIEVLVLVGVNPVYSMPAKSGFVEALAKVPTVVAVASRANETTARAHLVLPALHPLESWGDYEVQSGVIGLMQPTMGPVPISGKPVDAKATGDILLAVGRQTLGSEEGKGPLKWGSFQEFLNEEWQKRAKEFDPSKPFPEFWEEALKRGGVWRQPSAAPVPLRRDALAGISWEALKLAGDGEYTLIVYPSNRFFDGRDADKSWLQETPDPVTQVAWDAWVEVSPDIAREMNLTRGDLVKLTSPNGSIELPAYPYEFIQPRTVAVQMGQGHSFPGTYAKGVRAEAATNPEPATFLNVGANPVALLSGGADPASGGLSYLGVKVSLARTGARRPLPVPQGTFDQDHREIAQHVGLAAARELDLRGRPPEQANLPSMYPPVTYPDYRWGMSVDVDLCTGCSACVVACQSENNVPVTGREQVAYGRKQQWLRIERWQEGSESKPLNMFVPMFCQHCDVAPCEPVCPVYAAYHTRDGLNGQVYNRCVGTRYCGNACIYHVRYFNWFNYTWPEPLELQLNPDVTVRQLGVMEKCTMCLQRIQVAKDRARDAGRKVKDGDMQTACQQTCPTQAIKFGDLKDGASAVSKLSRSARGYHVFEEVGTRPAVTYLKKVVRGDAGKSHGKEHSA